MEVFCQCDGAHLWIGRSLVTPMAIRESSDLRAYLEEVRSHLYLDPPHERRVISELYTYFQEKVADLAEQGQSEQEATRGAIRSFGRAKVVARLMYEAYSQGSWLDAVIAALPHLIVAFLFSLHLWRHPVIAPAVFLTIVGVTLYGWWRGKPNWLYSWIGYSLFPFLVVGYQTRGVLMSAIAYLVGGSGELPPPWALVLLGTFYAFAGSLIIATTIRVVRRDWLLTSLMLVPLPILGIWLYNIEEVGGLFHRTQDVFFLWDFALAYVFAVLAAASAFFIRLRQRILKIGALLTIGTITGAIAVHNVWGNVGFFGILSVAVLLLLFLLSPALLEIGIGHGESKNKAWWTWVERPSADPKQS